MTVTKIYSCDLCTTPISADDPAAKGILWKADHKIEWMPTRRSEHHLCGKCLTALSEAIHAPALEPIS